MTIPLRVALGLLLILGLLGLLRELAVEQRWPVGIEARALEADRLLETGEFAAAAEVLRVAHAFEPTQTAVQDKLVHAWTLSDEFAAIEALSTELLLRQPEHVVMRLHLGDSFLHRGRYAEAVTHYAAIAEGRPVVQDHMAIALLVLGRDAEGRAACDAARAALPEPVCLGELQARGPRD